jgi:hypothetical protein
MFQNWDTFHVDNPLRFTPVSDTEARVEDRLSDGDGLSDGEWFATCRVER